MIKKKGKGKDGAVELSLDNLKFIFEKRIIASTCVPYETAYNFLEENH